MKYIYLLSILKIISLNMIMAQKASFNNNKIVAHRGAWKSKQLPQNSIASLKEAIRLGCAGSEFDVQCTIDDTLVVNHDSDFLGINVENNTYKQLCAKLLSNGETIPTLYNYLNEGIKQTKTKLILEIKESKISKARTLEITKKVVDMVNSLNANEWVIYISFDYDVLSKIKSLIPTAEVAYLNGDKTPFQLKENHIDGLNYNYKKYKKMPDLIKQAKENNLKLNAWTVNSTKLMDWLLDEGFDYITTDEPELLIERIKELSNNN